MNAYPDVMPSMIDRIRHDLVGLKMPRALEALDQVVRRLEHGELTVGPGGDRHPALRRAESLSRNS